MIRTRLTWLDALRGYAAAIVALFHLSPSVLGHDRHMAVYRHFDFGRYGVLLFFLVSGYVIPMSLERHGSLRRFWVGRVFRIYPAYLFAILVGVLLAVLGVEELHASMYGEKTASVLGHVTMFQDLIGLRGVVRPFWTLGYEMTFYLIVAALFVWGRHRDSVWWAGGLALTALLAGRHLPNGQFASTAHDRRITAAVLTAVVGASLLAYLSGRRRPILVAGVAGVGMVLLPLLNGQPTRWSTAGTSSGAVLLLAVMFAGTVVYRAQHGQIDRRAAAAVLGLVLFAAGINQWLLDGTQLLRNGSTAAAVAGTFAGGYLLRHRAVPGFLTWLGVVSYSVYLLHMPVLAVVSKVLRGHPFAILPTFVAGTLAAAWVAYRFVERPGQELGRRVQTYLDARFGPDISRVPITTEGGTPSTGSFGMQRESV